MLVMGRVVAPFGVRGWLRIQTLTARPENLRNYPIWWLRRGDNWREVPLAATKLQNDKLIAQFAGITDRGAAAAWSACEIALPRELLPQIRKDEFYWADLIGLEVIDAERRKVGQVVQILQTGANDVLVVEGANGQTLIPFIANVIQRVDLAAAVIEVDWREDFA